MSPSLSLRSSLGRSIAATVVVCLATWSIYAAWFYVDALRERSTYFDQQLELGARAVLSGFPRSFVENAPPTPLVLPNDVGLPLAEQFNYQVWRRQDRVMVSRSDTSPLTPLNPQFDLGLRSATIDGTVWRTYAVNDAAGEVHVQVGHSVAQREAMVLAKSKEDLLGLLSLMGLLVAGLIGIGIWTTAPLRRLQRAVASRAANDLTPISSHKLPAEAIPLVNAFNDLLARVRMSQLAQDRFVSDAAHELRTPLAAVRVQAQIAADSAERELQLGALERLTAGIDRATRVTEQLLTLARLRDDAPANSQADAVPINVMQRIEDLVEECRHLLLRRRIDVRLNASSIGRVTSDPNLVDIVLRNLIDNAMKYSVEGTVIEIDISETREAITVTIRNRCDTLTETDLARIREPFVRLQRNDESGSGLGLSIVERLCQRLGADFDLQSRDGHVIVRFALPTRSPC